MTMEIAAFNLDQEGRIRLATPKDSHAIAQLRMNFLEQIKWFSEEERQETFASQKTMFEEGIRNGSMQVWLFEQNQTVAATSALRKLSLKTGSGAQAELLAVYTRHEYRKKGIATRLVEATIDEARRSGFKTLVLQPTEDSFELYRKFGFIGTARHMSLAMENQGGPRNGTPA